MNWRKWCDEFLLAGKGILLVMRKKQFLIAFLIAFVFFGVLMNLLAGGFSKFELMAATGFAGAMKIIGDAFLGIFGVNKAFMDWLPTFLLAILQGILIGLIAFLWQRKREDKSANLESAGIITGLIALGAGCPTCGTTLLTPLIGAIAGAGSLAIAGTVSTVVTILAVVIAVLSLKRLGVETYVIIINDKYLARKGSKKNAESV